jgi:Zn-dependent peptidase ImmA (M78 family)
MNVPWLPKRFIANKAAALAELYRSRTGCTLEPPVPVETLIEKELGLTIGFEDLERLLGIRGVMGALYVEKKLILVDNSLLQADQEGRLSFTFAHEVGHWVLHRDLAVSSPLRDGYPRILCREAEAGLPLEWQANCFAACLMMPESALRDTFRQLYGDAPLRIYNFESAYCGPLGFDPCVANWPLIADAAIDCGRFSNVSRQAMIIRLQELGLLENLSGVPLNWSSLQS